MKLPSALASFVMLATLKAEWTPPAIPDPQKILGEARDDVQAKRYEDALAKHVWFHQHALEISPSLRGVRLSFALAGWKELAAAYPPALQKLNEVRDEAGRAAREGIDGRNAFNDFACINRTLEQVDKTVDLFTWLDANKPERAAEVIRFAQPALISTKKYELALKYLKPERDFASLLKLLREKNKLIQSGRFNDAQFQEFAERSFSNGTATLVALLVKAERRTEAEGIVDRAKKELDSPQLAAELKSALEGNVPAPWP